MKPQKGIINKVSSWVKRHPYISSTIATLTLAGAAAAYKWKDIYYSVFQYLHPKITIADIERDNNKLNESNLYLHMKVPRFRSRTKSGGVVDLLLGITYEFNTRTFFDDYFTLAVDSSNLSPQEKKLFSQLEDLIEGPDLVLEPRQTIADFLTENSSKIQELLSKLCENPSLDELTSFLGSYKEWEPTNLGYEITFQFPTQYNPIPDDNKKNSLDQLIEKTIGSYSAGHAERAICAEPPLGRCFVEKEHQQDFYEFVLSKAKEFDQKVIKAIYEKENAPAQINEQALSEMTPRQAAGFSDILSRKLIHYKSYLMPDSLYKTITRTKKGNCMIRVETATAIFNTLKEINPNLTHTHLLVGGTTYWNTNPNETYPNGKMRKTSFHSYPVLIQTDQRIISFLDLPSFISYGAFGNPSVYRTLSFLKKRLDI